MGTVATRVGRSAINRRLYPTLSPGSMTRICEMTDFRVATCSSNFCSSSSLDIPYKPIPKRTISYCAWPKLEMPDVFKIWRMGCMSNASIICVDNASNKVSWARVKSTNFMSSLAAKCDKILFTSTAWVCCKRAIKAGISCSINPNRCIPVSSLI